MSESYCVENSTQGAKGGEKRMWVRNERRQKNRETKSISNNKKKTNDNKRDEHNTHP